MVEYGLTGEGISELQEMGEVTPVKITLSEENNEKLKKRAEELYCCARGIDAELIKDYIRIGFKELDINGEEVESDLDWGFVVYATGGCYIEGTTDYTDKVSAYLWNIGK